MLSQGNFCFGYFPKFLFSLGPPSTIPFVLSWFCSAWWLLLSWGNTLPATHFHFSNLIDQWSLFRSQFLQSTSCPTHSETQCRRTKNIPQGVEKGRPGPQTCSVDCQLIVQVDSRQSRSDKPTPGELRQLAYHNSLPFIGFGFLDNFIMIVAGEYIDLTLGMKLGISTMVSFKSFKILAWLLFRQLQLWATPSRTWWGLGAPGNRITCYLMLNWKIWIIWPDCIFRYVESWAEKLGATPPNLSSEQLEMTR